MKFKKPKLKQILTYKPMERYLLDLQLINNNLKDTSININIFLTS